MTDPTIETKFIHAYRTLYVTEITDIITTLFSGPSFQLLDQTFREMVLELLTEQLQEWKEEGALQTYKVVGDKRNNNNQDILKGKFNILVEFRHKEAYITTSLNYKISYLDLLKK